MLERLTDLAGQADAVARLSAAVASGRLHHALLLAGPDGVGKHLTAQMICRVLFCRDRQGNEACMSCTSCVKWAISNHPDVLLLSPNEKNKITVDDVREATRALHVRPIEAPYKVLIIRDADRMNAQAQNALLKTLEEPPGASRILVTSSRPRSLLLTILSRCQRIDFAPVPVADVTRMLVDKRDLDPDRAQLLAALSQGSPARAFDADPDAIIDDRDRMADVDQQLSPSNRRGPSDAIQVAASLADDRADLRARLELLGVWLRDQIIVSSGSEGVEIANADRRDDITQLAHQRGLTNILNRARALHEAQRLLDAPTNYNAVMIAEQLCMKLAGHGTTS